MLQSMGLSQDESEKEREGGEEGREEKGEKEGEIVYSEFCREKKIPQIIAMSATFDAEMVFLFYFLILRNSSYSNVFCKINLIIKYINKTRIMNIIIKK